MKAVPSTGGAVVTGGGRGLGRAIARLLAERGHGVLVTDVDGDAAAAVAAEIGGRAASAVLDVRDDEACIAVAARAVDEFGSIDVWVNNAGILRTEPVWETDAASRRLLMEVNALGTMNGTLAALGPMRSAGRGHVVNIVSLAGLVAVPGEAVYAATKHAAIGFTLSTAADLRAAGEKGIALSAICPDGIWTPMLHDRLQDPHAAMSFSGRLLQPDEVVAAVAKVLDRPRSVTAIPPWRGPQVRFADNLPGFALRIAPLIVRSARRKQRKYARKLGPH
jgi:NAD(P)-dependent dehydrogenase (short-subunit alcohol dehydrogenase family)